jgi:hypothetical protein
MRSVELLKQWQGVSIVLSGKYGGKLRVEDGIVRFLPKGVANEFFSVGILFASDENVGEAGVGGNGFGVCGQDATVGRFGGVEIAGVGGEIGCEKSVVQCFGRELESFKKFIRGDIGVSLTIWTGLVEASECAPGASFQFWAGFAGIKGGGNEKFGVGFVPFALTSEEQSKGEV